MTGNATFRYGSFYLQPDLVDNALEKAKENETVKEKLGELQPHNFFRLLEGEVFYKNNNSSVAITVSILGTQGRGKLDIWAQKIAEKWEYDSIAVRIKKPEKLRIPIFTNNQTLSN